MVILIICQLNLCSSTLHIPKRSYFSSDCCTIWLHNHWRWDCQLSTSGHSFTKRHRFGPGERWLTLRQPKHSQHRQLHCHSFGQLCHVTGTTVRLRGRSFQPPGTCPRRWLRFKRRFLLSRQRRLCRKSGLEYDIGGWVVWVGWEGGGVWACGDGVAVGGERWFDWSGSFA